MDRDDDVERLFSWIKTPELHYREFAAEREVADAAASWPAPRDAVTEPSHPGEPAEPEAPAEAEPAPSGRPSLGERLTSLFAHREPPPEQAVVRAPPPPPVADLPRAQPAPRAQTPPRAQEDVAAEVPWTPEPPPQAFARLEPAPAPPAAPPRPAPMPPAAPPQPAPAAEQQYRGFEEPQDSTPPAPEPAHAAEKRSLDAIFSRVAHPAPAPRDDRKRASAAPGLGPVFRRLR